MIDALILTRHEQMASEFEQVAQNQDIQFEHVANVETALDLIAVDRPDFIIVADANIESIEKIISQLKEIDIVQEIDLFAACDFSESELRRNIWAKQVDDVLQLPVLHDELNYWLQGKLKKYKSAGGTLPSEADMAGRLEDFNAIDLVQMMEQRNRNAIIHLKRGDRKGSIRMVNGEIYDGTYRNFSSLEAVMHLMTWSIGEFIVIFDDTETERTVQLDNEQILLEALQRIDKRTQFLQKLPKRETFLYISPSVDLSRKNVQVSNYLKFFQGGKSINEFLDSFDIDELILLEQLNEMVQEKKLITRRELDEYPIPFELEAEESGVKGVIKKIFGRKSDSKAKIKVIHDEPNREETQIIEMARHFEHYFTADPADLKKLSEKIRALR